MTGASDSSPELLRQIDVCRRLGISDQSWMRWRKAGLTPNPVIMPSGQLKWRATDIDALTRTRAEDVPLRRRYFGAAARKRREMALVASGASR